MSQTLTPTHIPAAATIDTHVSRRLAFRAIAALIVVGSATRVFAQTPAAINATEATTTAATSIADAPSVMNEVVVSGLQSGPELWKITNGENIMWVLGTQSPLPKKIEWEPYRVQRLVANSQEVITGASASIDVDAGFFGKLALVPSLFKARKNPNGELLKDLLPETLYARWKLQKAKYIGKDKDVEEWRPIAAAGELYGEVLDRHQLRTGGVVWPVVAKAAKKNKVKVTEPKIKMKIKEPKKLIQEFIASPLNDLPCFEQTLERVENDVPRMIASANAWAVGDLNALRNLTVARTVDACDQAFLQSSIGKSQGFDDLPQRLDALWLQTAESALQKNRQTFAVLPMSQVIQADGLLAQLAAKGFVVTPPKALADGTVSSALGEAANQAPPP